MKPDPAGAAISYTKADLDDIGKVRAITPTVQDIAASCGVPVHEEVNQFGRKEVVARATTRAQAMAMSEAMRPSWRADTQRVGGMQERRSKTTLVDRNGRKKRVDSFAAEQVARATGMVEKWTAGGVRIVRGANGNLWRVFKNGTTEDTGRTCLTRPWFGEGSDDSPPLGSVVVH